MKELSQNVNLKVCGTCDRMIIFCAVRKRNAENPITKAAIVIKRGGVVVFPTETVYGLGADVFNETAVKKIFKLKRRPADNPLIVHIADKKDLRKVAATISPTTKKLIAAFWPGPLTLIFKKRPEVPDIVTAGLNTVAVRLPNHALARALIRAAGTPIAAPSANRSGRPSATEATHAKHDFGSRAGYLLAAEKSRLGIESTIINTLTRTATILRPGAIDREAIEKVIGKVTIVTADAKTIAPGMRHRHYAPRIKLIVVGDTPDVSLATIPSRIDWYHQHYKKVGVLAVREHCPMYKKADRIIALGSKKNMATCAAHLFGALRDFDRCHDVNVILAEALPETGLGATIMDRLRRASTTS